MQTGFLRKNLLRISLIVILLALLFACIYTMSNYKSSTNNNQNRMEQKMSGNWSNKDKNFAPPAGSTKRQRESMPNKGKNVQRQQGSMPNKNMRNNLGSSQKSTYAPLLTIYFAAFLILIAALYYLFKIKNIAIDLNNRKLIIFSMLCAGFLLRIALSTVMEGYGSDLNLFRSWAETASNNFLQFYSNARSGDYPPLYMYVLFLIGKIASISSINSYYTVLLKLPSILADIATAYIIYKLSSKYLSFEISVLISGFYIFNPAVFIDSTLWGQVDSFFALLIVISLFLLSEGKTMCSAVLFTCSVLMKPQGIIFLPVIFFELVQRRDIKLFIKSILSALITAVIIILPFSFNQSPTWIFKLYAKTISEYPYASVNGFNFFNLLGGNYKQSSSTFFIFSYQIWGMSAIVAVTLFTWFIYIKGKSRKFAFSAALIQIAGVFTFSTGMHERYLFPALALALLSFIYLRDKRILTLCAGYCITIYSNIYYILFKGSGMMNSSSHSIISDGTSILNIILFIYLIKILIDITKSKTLKEGIEKL